MPKAIKLTNNNIPVIMEVTGLSEKAVKSQVSGVSVLYMVAGSKNGYPFMFMRKSAFDRNFSWKEDEKPDEFAEVERKVPNVVKDAKAPVKEYRISARQSGKTAQLEDTFSSVVAND